MYEQTGETLQVPEAIAMQNKEVLPLNKRYMFMKQYKQRKHRRFLIVFCFYSDDLQDLVNEVALLREQNGLMEMELKEMQERYSEISLKFAEVEGERQQLVMTVRYLKNAKKR